MRIQDEELPDYAARVATMRSPIKRDGLMMALYTGLRSEDVRTMRFEQADWDDETLHLPNPSRRHRDGHRRGGTSRQDRNSQTVAI